MRIEDEIKQKKPFKNEVEKAMVNLIYTSNWLRELNESHFKSFGLTSKQYNILRILKGATKPLSTKEVRLRMLDKMSDVSRLVDRLEKKGLVVKIQNDQDLRLVDISISKQGKEILKKSNSKYLANNIKNNLSKKDFAKLSDLLDKLRG